MKEGGCAKKLRSSKQSPIRQTNYSFIAISINPFAAGKLDYTQANNPPTQVSSFSGSSVVEGIY